MMIDKVGGTGPSYGPRKVENPAKPEAPARQSDQVSISEEATRLLEAAKIARQAKSPEGQERIDKLKDIKEKLEKGDYNNLSDDVLSKLADKVAPAIFANYDN